MSPGIDGPIPPPSGVEWLAELPLAPAPPFHRMGVHPLDDSRWLLDGPDLEWQLAEKARLLAERPDEVVAALDGSQGAATEVDDLVDAWLARHRPTAPAADPTVADPLDRAGRRIAEDLCLLQRGGDGWTLTAATLCFPSRWRLADKLGRPIGLVHGPVPHYDHELATPVDRFLDRLRVERPVWRRNWTLHLDPALHQPIHEPPDTPADPAALHLRSEYQTLRRLPGSAAVLFTIRTQQVPLPWLEDPDARRRFAAVLRGLDTDLVAYKAADFDPEAVAAWLS